MDDAGRFWIGVIICAVIVLIMGFLTLCETSAVEFSDSKLKKMSKNDKKANRLRKLIEKPNRLLVTSIIIRSIMIIFISVTATIYFYSPLSVKLLDLLGMEDLNNWQYYGVCFASFFIISCILAVAITVFGINLPKKLCVSGKVSERFILNISGFYRGIVLAFFPIEALCEIITKPFMRIFGVKTSVKPESVTEEEILMMVDAVNENGSIEESQAEMISNIFEFDDLEVSEIMTHRTELVAIEQNNCVTDAVKLAIDEGVSRIPVYNENVDNICGVIFVKDLLKLVFDKTAENHKVKEFMHEIRYVPETNNCRELFDEFTSQKTQIAVVVDEYGGTAGIVTMEDLLECIVGNIQDEYDDEVEEIQEITPNTFDLLGNANFEEAMEALGKEPAEGMDYDTIGGFIIDVLGYIPKDGETPEIHWDNIVFTIINIKDRKIKKLRAVIKKEITEENGSEK
ncbi:MAG: hemolysin family protein [Hominimerdicola sp.]